MVNCDFCGTNIMPGTGFMYVKKDSKVLRFCSRKCEKNMLVLGRKPRNITWTTQARDVKKARLATQASNAPAKTVAKKAATKKAPAKSAAKKSASVKE